jgi:hypothetical protein
MLCLGKLCGNNLQQSSERCNDRSSSRCCRKSARCSTASRTALHCVAAPSHELQRQELRRENQERILGGSFYRSNGLYWRLIEAECDPELRDNKSRTSIFQSITADKYHVSDSIDPGEYHSNPDDCRKMFAEHDIKRLIMLAPAFFMPLHEAGKVNVIAKTTLRFVFHTGGLGVGPLGRSTTWGRDLWILHQAMDNLESCHDLLEMIDFPKISKFIDFRSLIETIVK